MKIKVLIADSKGEQLKDLTALIEKDSSMELLNTAEKLTQIIKGLNLNPDVLILNPSLFYQEELSGIIQKIKKRAPKIGILLFLKRDVDDKTIMDALIDGARGYIRKSEIPRYLSEAIKSIAGGEVWAERRIVNRFITATPLIQKSVESKLKALSTPLTKREKIIIFEVLKGASNREISKKYKITEMTVKTHLYRIYKKMKIKSRAQAIAYLIYS